MRAWIVWLSCKIQQRSHPSSNPQSKTNRFWWIQQLHLLWLARLLIRSYHQLSILRTLNQLIMIRSPGITLRHNCCRMRSCQLIIHSCFHGSSPFVLSKDPLVDASDLSDRKISYGSLIFNVTILRNLQSSESFHFWLQFIRNLFIRIEGA